MPGGKGRRIAGGETPPVWLHLSNDTLDLLARLPTQRERIATQLLAGILANPDAQVSGTRNSPEHLAHRAAELAEALIVELEAHSHAEHCRSRVCDCPTHSDPAARNGR